MAFTKVLGPGIHTLSNITSHNIHSSGIITAISFVGDGSGLTGVASTDNIVTGTAATFNTYPVDINAGMTVAGVATFAGNVSIAGTLTYEDVTNIDSVGIITGKGADINGDLDVDGHTNLDNVSIAGVTTHNEDVWFKGATTNRDAYWDKSDDSLEFYDNAKAAFGTNSKATLHHSGAQFFIQNTQGGLYLRNNNKNSLIATPNDEIWLYYDNDVKLKTSTKGITVGTGVTIETNGQATFVGIVTFGSSSTTINGNTDTINVGTALTIGHSQGLQYHTQNLHAQGFEVNQINASGIITATTFSGSGASLTNLNGSNIASGTVPVARIGTGTKNTSTFYRGDGTFATVTAPAITAINSASNNRIVTSDGGTTVTAESNLTFDGSKLQVNSQIGIGGAPDDYQHLQIKSANPRFNLLSSGTNAAKITFGDSGDSDPGTIEYQHSSTEQMKFAVASSEKMSILSTGQIKLQNGSFSSNVDCIMANGGTLEIGAQSTMKFRTATNERLRIDSTGRISAGKHGVGTHNDGNEYFKIQSNDTSAVLSIIGSNDTHSTLALGDEDDFNRTRLRADHTNDKLQFYVADTERLILQNGGILSQRVNSNARFSHGILEITSSSSPSQLKISTNIPYSGFSHAESVTIRGFRYGGRDTVDIQICWHVYNNTFYNRIASSSGAWAPTITLAVESGKVVIHFNSLGYWHKIYVADYYSAYGDYDYARGWSYSFSAISGDSGTPVETVPYKNDWGGLTYNDNHNAGGGDLHIHDGNLIVASGHGIDFSNTANAGGGTMSSELLDDYEEGSWTPSYSRPNMSISHGYREGYYTKVGRTVHVVGRLHTTSESGSSSGGPILVTGLPYTVRGVRCALSVRPSTWSNDHPSFATFELNQTHFELLEEVEGNPSGSSDLGGGRFAGGNGNYLWFSGSYITDT